MLSGTEADIINAVARLREATKDQIRRDVGFSLEYVEFLCRHLVRKGYLALYNGRYSLAEAGIKTQPAEETKIDKRLIKEIADEVAREISGQLNKTAKEIKIKTDFEFPVEDESLALKSNINKIGLNFKKEKSDIDEPVKLFKEIQKRRRDD